MWPRARGLGLLGEVHVEHLRFIAELRRAAAEAPAIARVKARVEHTGVERACTFRLMDE